MSAAPPRLNVQSDLDGFRCDLPGLTRGSNSGWLLPFVALWYGLSVAVFALALQIQPDLIDQEMSVLGGVGMMVFAIGWAPGWMLADRAWARAHPRLLEADAVQLTLEERSWPFATIDALRISGGYLSFSGEGFRESVRLGTTPLEEDWLEQALVPLWERVHARDGDVPREMDALVEGADAER